MACIPLEKAKSGMKLAEDVYNHGGKVVLCKKGTLLTEAIIQRLVNMGVEKIVIEESLSTQEMRQLIDEKMRLIEEAFSGKDSECMQMLKEAFLDFWRNKFEISSPSIEVQDGKEAEAC